MKGEGCYICQGNPKPTYLPCAYCGYTERHNKSNPGTGIFAGWRDPKDVADILREHHYLGPSKRGWAWADNNGVMVFAKPTARNVPATWLELVRWCIIKSGPNTGSQQWGAVIRELRKKFPDVTTIISYSDPSVGHTGALYRACNWWWAPTWHRLRPPPTGNGAWQEGKTQSVKDRWIFPVRKDPKRIELLVAKDDSILRRHPEWRYKEPGGVPYEALPTPKTKRERAIADGI